MHGTRYLAKQYLPLPCHLSKDVCYSLSSRSNNSFLFVFLHSTIICVCLLFFLCLICVVYSVYFVYFWQYKWPSGPSVIDFK